MNESYSPKFEKVLGLIRIIDLEVDSLETRTLSINGLDITVTGNSVVHGYLNSLMGSYCEFAEAKANINLKVINPSLSTDNLRALVLGCGGYLVLGTTHIFCAHKYTLIIKYEEDSIKVINIGDNIKFGVSSTLRKLLLKHFMNSKRGTIFHAATIVDDEGEAIVISSNGDTSGEGKGKTTTMLSAVTQCQQQEYSWGMVTNDDLLLDDAINYYDLPAEIPVKKDTLDNLSIKIDNAEFEYPNGDLLVTRGTLEDSGITLASGFSDISQWLFLDLQPKDAPPEIKLISGQDLDRLFIRSVHLGRLKDMTYPLEVREGGVAIEGESILEYADIQQIAMNILELLKISGTQFFVVTGGMNLKELSKMIFKIRNGRNYEI